MALYSNKAIKQEFKEYLRQQVTALPYQVTLVVYLIGNDAMNYTLFLFSLTSFRTV
jgi:hypothetical protein